MSKHMDQSDRNQICFGLDTGKTINKIVCEIGKEWSTITLEIKRHALTDEKGGPYRIKKRYANRVSCHNLQVYEDYPEFKKCLSCT